MQPEFRSLLLQPVSYTHLYNEYITDVIIAIIVYLSAFSLVIKMFISGQRKRRSKAALPAAEAAAKPPEGGGGAEVEKGGESA